MSRIAYNRLHHFLACSVVAVLIMLIPSEASAQTAQPGQLIISELRNRGPNGANDEYIEIYNNSGADHTVLAASGTGYGIAASDGTTRCSIPNGTVIPAGGHYLCVNSVGYSLASYPAGNGTTATGDATYTTDIPDNAGIALFNNNTGGGSYSLANRIDAAGTTSEANTLFKEGPGVPALTPFSIDSAWVRDACGKGGSITDGGPCTQAGAPKDTDNNAADFYFVDTNGTSAGGGQRLGAPGPENLSAPVSSAGSISKAALDPCVADGPPNLVRDYTSDPANNSTFGTIDVRRRFTNNTGGNVTSLRFRIVDLTTFPAPSGFADLRPRTSTAVVVTVDRPPCGSGTSNVTVQGTTLQQPPMQPNGGGFNSSLGAGSVTLATPLANGASIDLRFLFGIQQTGYFRVGIAVEALPGGGAANFFALNCHTDSGCSPNPVSIFFTSPDNRLSELATNRDASAAVVSLVPGGGSSSHSPAVAVLQDRQYIALKGATGNNIYVKSRARGGSFADSLWTQVPGTTSSSPALCTFNNRLYLFVKGGSGNVIYYRWLVPAVGWSGWSSLSGSNTLWRPGVVVFDSRLYHFESDAVSNRIWYRSLGTDGTWSQWSMIPTGTTNVGPTPIVHSGKIWLFAKGLAGKLLWWSSTPTPGTPSSWSAWASCSGSTEAAPGVGLDPEQDLIHLAVTGNMVPRMWHRTLDPATLLWSNWHLLTSVAPEAQPIDSPTVVPANW